MSVGQEPEVANSAKAVWQNMQQESADELITVERHHLWFFGLPVVFPTESHLAILKPDQPAIGDGDAVSVAAEIVKNLLRPAKRSFGIDHPVDLPKFPLLCSERSRFGELAELSEKM